MTGIVNRRKFLKGSALAATATAATLAAPSIANDEPTVIKMQAAWGGGIFLEGLERFRILDDLPHYFVHLVLIHAAPPPSISQCI
ncbi:MAG: twin-arginine translocation signal domain-containing protein [Deltaproteobacteria bacterium]|nr:twin-arginine translocation signal domain-containing protein [Deltaproteobacteria bacterium]